MLWKRKGKKKKRTTRPRWMNLVIEVMGTLLGYEGPGREQLILENLCLPMWLLRINTDLMAYNQSIKRKVIAYLQYYNSFYIVFSCLFFSFLHIWFQCYFISKISISGFYLHKCVFRYMFTCFKAFHYLQYVSLQFHCCMLNWKKAALCSAKLIFLINVLRIGEFKKMNAGLVMHILLAL